MRALIVDGSPEPSSPALVARLAGAAEYVAAVDRGAAACREAGVTPDLFVGDEDSIDDASREWVHGTARATVRLEVEKDATDLAVAIELARKEAERRGEEPMLTLTCVTGGRPDHALAIYGLLLANRDASPVVVEDGHQMAILSPKGTCCREFSEREVGGTVSVISLLPGTVVSERGMRWDLEREELPLLDDRGVSNIVLQAGAMVTCHKGCVAVYLIG